jgi:hypothetical protein
MQILKTLSRVLAVATGDLDAIPGKFAAILRCSRWGAVRT